MKLFFLPFILLLQSLAGYSQLNNSQPVKGKTYAVVVGISKYENMDEDSQLEFADEDARVFAGYLRSAAGGSVPEENIKLLLNKDATYSNIYDALKWLLDSCQKNDLAYFYFSGHGSLENITMSQEAYLISYNTLPNNFAYNAVRIGYVNDLANTLSARNNGKVILITDACHSGSVSIDATGMKLAADQLRKTRSNEIRLSSCQKDQLSNEDIFWGGGRSVFSYYLVKGLMGEADLRHDHSITVSDIKIYLDSVFSIDKKLASLPEQKPLIAGNDHFKLATVSGPIVGSSLQPTPAPVVQNNNNNELKPLPVSPLKYFFSLLEKENIKLFSGSAMQNPEDVIDFKKLVELPAKDIPFAVIKYVADSLGLPEYSVNKNRREGEPALAPVRMAVNSSGAQQIEVPVPDIEQINKLDEKLQQDNDVIKKFNDQLVSLINNRTQEIINGYLKGDAAELEKRQYYNSKNDNYAVYLEMFDLALKLATPGNEAYRILQLKKHYYTGVVARLKLPTVADPVPLIDSAIAEQQKAMAMEHEHEPAAYIRNELGILYKIKKETALAKKYFLNATAIAPKWAIPWANLAALYADTKEYDKGFKAAYTADSLQPNLQLSMISAGMLYENSGNYLLAEENFRKCIRQNELHYFPFERMGYVSMNSTQYATADSFFYQAALKKKSYQFGGYGSNSITLSPHTPDRREISMSIGKCFIEKAEVSNTNLMGKLVLAYMMNDEPALKNLIRSQKENPLAYHYLAKLLFEQHRWQEAEIILKMAFEHYMDNRSFDRYTDSLYNKMEPVSSKSCIVDNYRQLYYKNMIDHYYLAAVYDSWGHFTEAENEYRYIIASDSTRFTGYQKLAAMLERRGRYDDAAQLLAAYKKYGRVISNKELGAFYERMLDRSPGNAYWNYKAGCFFYDLVVNGVAGDRYGTSDGTGLTLNEYYKEEIDAEAPDYQFMNINIAAYIPEPSAAALYYLSKADSLFREEPSTPDDINLKIGNLYLRKNELLKALLYFKRSDDQYPGNANTRSDLAAIYPLTYDYKLALEQLDTLYKHDQLNYTDQLTMANYCMLAGRFKDADSLLKRAEKVYPFKQTELSGMNGRLQLLSKNPAKAIPFYNDWLAANPKDFMAMYTMARLYAQLDNKPGAWKWLQMAIHNGFKYYWVLSFDPAWDGLRRTGKWKELAGKIKMPPL